jgi:hypothetical protein
MCARNMLMSIARSSVGIMHAMRKEDVVRGMRGMGRVRRGLVLGGGTEVLGGLGNENEGKELSKVKLEVIVKI